jgi:hypothetical protein
VFTEKHNQGNRGLEYGVWRHFQLASNFFLWNEIWLIIYKHLLPRGAVMVMIVW